MKKIVVFASGNGSNAEAIMQHFYQSTKASVVALFSNKSDCYALERARKFQVPSVVFNKAEFKENQSVLNQLINIQPDIIVLAGFLWLIPPAFVQAFPNKIINIHPSLLPKYGGQGMYGMRVHEAVVDAGETESGITIHYVNEHFDEGEIIFQASCSIQPKDTAADVAHKIHLLEQTHFPEVIASLLA